MIKKVRELDEKIELWYLVEEITEENIIAPALDKRVAEVVAKALAQWSKIVDCGVEKAAATQNGICLYAYMLLFNTMA